MYVITIFDNTINYNIHVWKIYYSNDTVDELKLPGNFDHRLESAKPMDVSRVMGFTRGVHITYDRSNSMFDGGNNNI